jgi:hypothetical protein
MSGRGKLKDPDWMLDIGRANAGVESPILQANPVSGGGQATLQDKDAELLLEVKASLAKAGLSMPDDKIAEVIAKARIFDGALQGRTSR